MPRQYEVMKKVTCMVTPKETIQVFNKMSNGVTHKMIHCVTCSVTGQSEPIIIMISHIMINQLYHIVSITGNRPKILSYHLKIWYMDSENYHIISKVILRFLKFSILYQNWYLNFKIIISYQKWYLNFQNYHIISKWYFNVQNYHFISKMIL